MIETLVCVLILAVLISLAVPELRNTVTRQRLNGVRNELITSMHTARSEAMRRGVTVALQRRTDCADSLTHGDDWSCGWREVTSDGLTASGNPAMSDVLQSFDVPSGLQLLHQGGGEAMQFAASGHPLLVASKFIVGPRTVAATPDAMRLTATLCINRTGKIRTVEGRTLC